MTFGGFRLSQDDMSKLWTKMPESEKSTIKKSLRRYKKMSKYQVITMKKRKYMLYDAFETKSQAQSSAKDLRNAGDTAQVKKISAQAGGRLKWGLFSAGARKKTKR